MGKQQPIYLDFELDKLTKSIENTVTGDSFQTEVSHLTIADLKQTTKKNGWNFNWRLELNANDRDVYKLTIVGNPNIIQGCLSFTIKDDHVYMHLLESSPFNIGRIKIYEGVPGNLVAFACKVSFQHGNEGFVSFQSKTTLIKHYVKTLGAYHFGGHLMVIPTPSAQKLINNYFKT